MINFIKIGIVTATLFLLFGITTDLSAATSQTTNIELNTSSIDSYSAVINPDTSYSPAAGDKIVDQRGFGPIYPEQLSPFRCI
ncbi:MAG: hypothetical protein CM1200mP37_5520 [Chloroflexota bacterium]|nr:MAG: hypothetical protein CM1200mP37_5520 [Chloroflexota bacterium]